ncbi:MAG: efflux RND transporter periplasmic adaptor subunit [Herminiimonas sp.]|nr:efflux RND transporter periplasmic adaptor subunit [Herminiimonas sp.]
MKNLHPLVHPSARSAVRSLTLAVAVVSALAVTACSKPVEKVEEIRPVRVITLAAVNADVEAQFSGDVRARVESRLGFRVGGKIIARKVDVGTVVKRGQVLMQLDPQDLRLAQAQSNAGMQAAESNRFLAQEELKRYKDLRGKNFVSQAVLDGKETAFKAAQASYDQAVAGFKNQSNQTGYTTLVADADGVVTGVDAETGQVVAPGTTVVRVAKAGEKEVVIGIPEDKVEALRRVTDVRVRTWAKPDQVLPGKIREISPIADPVTRTYTARVSIADAPADVRLGMTAFVTFSSKSPTAMIKVPLTALLQEKNSSAVWIVENGTVKLMPVQIGSSSGNDILLANGVKAGQTVVTAGVNLLKPGQKVKILDEAAVAGETAPPAAQKTADTSSAGAATVGVAK